MNVTGLVGIGSVLLASSWALAQDPRITIQPTNTTVSLGATSRFVAAATTANPPLTWQWWFKDSALDTNANPSAATRSLSLTNVTLAQAGPYFVAVTNAAGSSTNSQIAILTVTIDQFEAVELKSHGITNLSCASWIAAWGDYDNDDYLDLYVGNTSADWSSGYVNFLYRNNRNGTFTRRFASEVGPPAGDSDRSWCSCFWADVNNDGFLDLVVGNCARSPQSPPVPCRLYRNEGNGRFSSVSGGDLGEPRWFSSPNLGDYDNDGWLDMFLAMQWAEYGVRTNALLHGRGDGTFSIVTHCVVATDESAGVSDADWGDYDNDGDLDLVVPHGLGPASFYRNDGNGQFTHLTDSILERLQIAVTTWADYDNDGFLDLGVGSNPGSRIYLLRNNGLGDFVLDQEWPVLSGCSFADYDNDGHLDLLLARGSLSSDTNILLHNNGDGTWTSVPDAMCRTADRWEMPVWGDYDNDGFLDVWITNVRGANALFHNVGHANGNTNHWIKFILVGTASNRSAIGAKVRVKATIGGKTFWQMREISGSGFASDDPRPNFGLGDATVVELVRIEWPSGLVQEFQNVPADQILKITEHQEGPISAPSLTATPPTEGTVQLTLTGDKNFLYVFEASTNLVQWTKLGVRTNLTGTVEFTDTAAAKYAQRFYRGVAP